MKLIEYSENNDKRNQTWIIKKNITYKYFLLHKITDKYYITFYQELNGKKYFFG